MEKVVIHIGYPKTATTTLQNNLFPNLNEWEYLHDTPTPSGNLNAEKVTGKKPNVLLSNERLMGIKKGYSYPDVSDMKKINEREGVKTTLLVTVRSQISIIKSIFSFFYGLEGTFGYENINEFVKEEIEVGTSKNVKEWLKYDRNISRVKEEAGFENVTVLKYEDFKQKRDEFYEEISEVLEVDKKEVRNVLEEADSYNVQYKKDKSYTKPSLLYTYASHAKAKYLPTMKPLDEYPFGEALKRLISISNEKIRMSEESKLKIKEEYKFSNQRLFENFSIRNYGQYPVPGEK